MKKAVIRRRKPVRRRLTLEQHRYRAEDIRRAYFEQFSGEQGRLVLEDMEDRYNVWKGTLPLAQGRGIDPLAFAWSEGRRSVVLDIYELMEQGREGRMPEGPQRAETETGEAA